MQRYDGTCAEYAFKVKTDNGLTAFSAVFSRSAAGGGPSHYWRGAGEYEAAEEALGFKSISAKLHQTLQGRGDARVCLKANKARETGLRFFGRLMLARKMDTQAGRMSAVYSPEPAIAAGPWVAVHGGTAEQQKALCAYWNSTPARLQLLNVRPKKLTYPTWSGADMGAVRVPRGLAEPGSEATRVLCDAYEAVKDTPLKPNREMGSCPVRKLLDEAAAEACGFAKEEVSEWREAVAAEPTIKGRKGAAAAP